MIFSYFMQASQTKTARDNPGGFYNERFFLTEDGPP